MSFSNIVETAGAMDQGEFYEGSSLTQVKAKCAELAGVSTSMADPTFEHQTELLHLKLEHKKDLEEKKKNKYKEEQLELAVKTGVDEKLHDVSA